MGRSTTMEDIVKSLLELSPPGEIKNIEADLLKIADPEMVNATNPAAYKAYNQSQMISVDHEDHQVLISEFGLLDGDRYLDPRNKQVITIDHVQQSVVSSEPSEASHEGAKPELRAAIDAELQQYVASAYPGAASAVYPDLTICISSGLFAPNKYWNGRWTSTWRYSDGTLSGEVKVHVHYYEKGNVHKTVRFAAELPGTPADGPAIVSALGAKELEFHRQLTEDAANIKESFKSLRRALPVTKKPIDWKNIQSEARVGKELSGLLSNES